MQESIILPPAQGRSNETTILNQDKITIGYSATGKITAEVRIGTQSLLDSKQARDVINKQADVFNMLKSRFPGLKMEVVEAEFKSPEQIEKEVSSCL